MPILRTRIALIVADVMGSSGYVHLYLYPLRLTRQLITYACMAEQLASDKGGIYKDTIEFDHITGNINAMIYRRFPIEDFWRLIARPASQSLVGCWDTANFYGMQKLAKLDQAPARALHYNGVKANVINASISELGDGNCNPS